MYKLFLFLISHKVYLINNHNIPTQYTQYILEYKMTIITLFNQAKILFILRTLLNLLNQKTL